MKFLLLSIPFFLVLKVQAGDKVRNGGDYVNCRSTNVSFFYDYYELTRIKKQASFIPKINNNPFDSALKIISLQNTENGRFQEKITNYIEEMRNSMSLVEPYYETVTDYILQPINPNSNPLPDIDDNPSIEKKSACGVGQAAISGYFNGAWKCFVFAPAWDLMAYESRVALILHEVIYRLARENGHSNSVNVIKLNQALLTSGERPPLGQMIELRRSLNLLVSGE